MSNHLPLGPKRIYGPIVFYSVILILSAAALYKIAVMLRSWLAGDPKPIAPPIKPGDVPTIKPGDVPPVRPEHVPPIKPENMPTSPIVKPGETRTAALARPPHDMEDALPTEPNLNIAPAKNEGGTDLPTTDKTGAATSETRRIPISEPASINVELPLLGLHGSGNPHFFAPLGAIPGRVAPMETETSNQPLPNTHLAPSATTADNVEHGATAPTSVTAKALTAGPGKDQPQGGDQEKIDLEKDPLLGLHGSGNPHFFAPLGAVPGRVPPMETSNKPLPNTHLAPSATTADNVAPGAGHNVGHGATAPTSVTAKALTAGPGKDQPQGGDQEKIDLEKDRLARATLVGISTLLYGLTPSIDLIKKNLERIKYALVNQEDSVIVDKILKQLRLPDLVTHLAEDRTKISLEILETLLAKYVTLDEKAFRARLESLWPLLVPWALDNYIITPEGVRYYPLKFILGHYRALRENIQDAQTFMEYCHPAAQSHEDSVWWIAQYLTGDAPSYGKLKNDEKVEGDFYLPILDYSSSQIERLIEELNLLPQSDTHQPDLMSFEGDDDVASQKGNIIPQEPLVTILSKLGFTADESKAEKLRTCLRAIWSHRKEEERVGIQNAEEFNKLMNNLRQALGADSHDLDHDLNNFLNMPDSCDLIRVPRSTARDANSLLVSLATPGPFTSFTKPLLSIDINNKEAFSCAVALIDHWIKSNNINITQAKKLRDYIFREYIQEYPYKQKGLATQEQYFEVFEGALKLLGEAKISSTNMRAMMRVLTAKNLLLTYGEQRDDSENRKAVAWINHCTEKANTKLEGHLHTYVPFIRWICRVIKEELVDVEIKPLTKWPLDLFGENIVDKGGETNFQIFDEALTDKLYDILKKCNLGNIYYVLGQLDLKGFALRSPNACLPLLRKILSYWMQLQLGSLVLFQQGIIVDTAAQLGVSLPKLVLHEDAGYVQPVSDITMAWCEYLMSLIDTPPTEEPDSAQLNLAIIHLAALGVINIGGYTTLWSIDIRVHRMAYLISSSPILQELDCAKDFLNLAQKDRQAFEKRKTYLVDQLEEGNSSEFVNEIKELKLDQIFMYSKSNEDTDLLSGENFSIYIALFIKVDYRNDAAMRGAVSLIELLHGWVVDKDKEFNFRIELACIYIRRSQLTRNISDDHTYSIEELVGTISSAFEAITCQSSPWGPSSLDRQIGYRDEHGKHIEHFWDSALEFMNERMFKLSDQEMHLLGYRMKIWIRYACCYDRHLPRDSTPFTAEQYQFISTLAKLNPWHIGARLDDVPIAPAKLGSAQSSSANDLSGLGSGLLD